MTEAAVIGKVLDRVKKRNKDIEIRKGAKRGSPEDRLATDLAAQGRLPDSGTECQLCQ